MQLQRQAFDVLADYHQFYLWDRDISPDAPVDYNDDDIKRRIKAGPHVVVIQPERNTTVPVEVEIHDSDPAHQLDDWDHVVEASLDLPTGHLQIHECTGGPVAEFDVAPGWYRVRSLHRGLGTIDESGLEGNDRYQVLLWPAPPAEVRVLKQWL